MHRRSRTAPMRSLTPDEIARVERLIEEFWPGRPVAQQYVEWNRYLVIDWQPGNGPVTQVRLPLDYLNDQQRELKGHSNVQLSPAIAVG